MIHCQQIISVVSTQISFPFHLPIHRSLLTTGRKISLFAYNFEIRKNYLKSLFHFLKLEESINFFSSFSFRRKCRFLFLFSKLEKFSPNFSFSSWLVFFASRQPLVVYNFFVWFSLPLREEMQETLVIWNALTGITYVLSWYFSSLLFFFYNFSFSKCQPNLLMLWIIRQNKIAYISARDGGVHPMHWNHPFHNHYLNQFEHTRKMLFLVVGKRTTLPV